MSLNWSFTPAALVELGYMTNKTEDALLNDPAYQLKLAQGLVNGLCRYFGR
jgi:N-acetylmuramoyl-L-alanine amidase